MEFTKDQLIGRLKTDVPFMVGFALDNNFEGIRSGIFKATGKTFAERLPLRDYILVNLKTSLSPAIISAITHTPYLPDAGGYIIPGTAGNYTIGFEDYFNSFMPATAGPTTKSFSFSSLFSALGAGLTAYAGSQQQQQNTGTGSGMTDAQIAAAKAEAEKAAKEAEEAEARKKRNTILIISGVVVVLIGLGIYFYTRKKKTA